MRNYQHLLMLSTQKQKKRPKTKRLESGEDKVNNEELL